ncbi:MAG: hypothetical protein ACXVH7_01845 [Thermoanaerobaculia bacterium]
MPATDISQLPAESRIWVFGISPSLDAPKAARLLDRVDAFLADWNAHGHPIRAARDIRERSFLVIAVDQQAETSGCSIDRLFGTLRQLERDLGVAILDANRVFVRHGDGHVDAITRDEFTLNGDRHTIVFDTTAERLGEIRSGAWERHAEDSWHAKLLGIAALRV